VIRRGAIAGVIASVTCAAALSVAIAGPAGASGWAQYGGRVQAWMAAHPIDRTGCPSGPCYGRRIPSQSQSFEFTHISTARGRVDGYDEALPNHTSQAAAALRALTLLPHDATAGSITIDHDRYGQSCAFVNFQSKTLKAWFGPNLLAGSGTVGVELVTVTGQGHVTYNPARVNLLIVAPIYLGSGDNC
jgi:hypothetical protein